MLRVAFHRGVRVAVPGNSVENEYWVRVAWSLLPAPAPPLGGWGSSGRMSVGVRRQG